MSAGSNRSFSVVLSLPLLPPLQAYERLIRPAVTGVENVLASALTVPTLEKVVLTSSLAAVVGDTQKFASQYLHTESDWNEVATEIYHPYNRSSLDLMRGENILNYLQSPAIHCNLI